LSLGEVPQETFSLYRRRFAVFVRITAIPYARVLPFEWLSGFFSLRITGRCAAPLPISPGTLVARPVLALIVWILYLRSSPAPAAPPKLG
jgi:hypothetical protein